MLTGTNVQILTPEKVLQGDRRGGPLPYSLKHLRRLQHLDVSLFYLRFYYKAGGSAAVRCRPRSNNEDARLHLDAVYWGLQLLVCEAFSH